MEENQAQILQTNQNESGQVMTSEMNGRLGIMPYMHGDQANIQGKMPRKKSYKNLIYCEDPIKELALSTGALIRKEIEKLEVVSGCETQNQYYVLIQSGVGLKMIFKCIESIGLCCGGLRIEIKHTSSPAEIVEDICKPFLRGQKSCCEGCLCFCRPQMNIKLEENQKHIGGIREPFTCCGHDYEIYDDKGNTIYQVIDSEIIKNNEVKGFIRKQNIAIGEYFPKDETYEINFPLKASPEEKILLICTAFLIVYFEKGFSSKKNSRKGQ